MRFHRTIRMSVIFCAIVPFCLVCTKDPASPDQQRDELKPKGTISGYVYTSDGSPLKDVVVSIDADSGAAAVTDVNGAFTIRQVLEGTYTLRFSRWDYETDTSYEVTVGFAENVSLGDTVHLKWAYFIIAGKVLYNSTPLPGAGVCVAEGNESKITDENGEYCLWKVPKAPSLKLICAKSGFGFNTLSGLKGRDDDTLFVPDIDLREHVGATVSGTVYDSLGNPMGNVVVAAVGGGLADTTNTRGEYVLRNFPSSEQLRIYVPGQKEQFGAVSGFSVDDRSFVSSIDIHMRPKGDYQNGMALSVADLHVVDTLASARLSVYPSVNDVTITIAGYTWTLAGDDTLTVTTTEPWLEMAMDSLQALLAGAGYEITVEVSATNGENASSLTETFYLFIHGTSPTVVAGGATSTGGTLGDTVKVTSGDFVYLSGSATDYFGGLDTVSWDFGDGSEPWVSTDSLIEVVHRYKKAGTHHAEFRALDMEGNEVRDTVAVVVSAGAVGVPVYVDPADGDTATADTVRFVWHPVTGDGVMYRLCLDADNRPPRTIVADSLTDTSCAAAVDSGTVYQWYVEAFNEAGRHAGDTLSLTGRLAGADSSSTVPTDGLVAWYPFDGDARDASGNGNHGTPTGVAMTVDRFGRTAMALRLSGNSSYVRVPDNPTLDLSNRWSLVGWGRTTNTADENMLLEKGGWDAAGAGEYGLMINEWPSYSGRARVTHHDLNGDYTTSRKAGLADGKWHMVAATWDGDTVRLYVDGFLDTALANEGAMQTDNEDLFIGARYGTSRDSRGTSTISVSTTALSPRPRSSSCTAKAAGAAIPTMRPQAFLPHRAPWTRQASWTRRTSTRSMPPTPTATQ